MPVPAAPAGGSGRRGTGILLRDVELGGTVLDCRIVNGVVAELGARLGPGQDRLVHCDGGALLPGLAEHHTHVRAIAARDRSVDVSGIDDLDSVELPGDAGWIRMVGVDREISRADLDRLASNRPLRAQHRSGALWTMNSAAVALLAEELDERERASGQVWRDDRRLQGLLRLVEADRSDSLTSLSESLASRGVTHVTDASPDLTEREVASLDSEMAQHVTCLGAPTGPAPVKVVIEDHLDYDLDEVLRRARAARAQDRAVALHAVTAPALAIAIAVLSEIGATRKDRIEHAAVCDDGAAERLAEIGVTVVTQPGIYRHQRARLLRECEPAEVDWLWRAGSLERMGIPLALSSDAPYGPTDPWETVTAAVDREPTSAVDERLDPEAAVASLLTDPLDPGGPRRKLIPGAPADVCVMTGSLESVLHGLPERSPRVQVTLISGQIAYLRSDKDS